MCSFYFSFRFRIDLLDLDLLWLCFLRLWHCDGQNSVPVRRGDLVRIHASRECDTAAKRADVTLSALGLLFSGWSPALDLYQNNDNLVAVIELPGMRKEEIEIAWHD